MQGAGSAQGVQGALEEAQVAIKAIKRALSMAEACFKEIRPEVLRKHPWLFEYTTPIEEAQHALRSLKLAIDKGLNAGRAGGREPGSSVPLSTRCAVCGDPQFETPGGVTCKNGHGGADPIRCPDVKPGELDCGRESCDKCYEAFKYRNRSADVERIVNKEHREQGRRITPKHF
jgi:hypothetical protein